MAKVYISEYARGTLGSRGTIYSAEEPAVATQVIDTGGGAIASAVFNKETRYIRVHTDGIMSYRFGTAPVAVTTDSRMAANQTEYFGVPPASVDAANEGYKIGCITNT